MSTASSHRGMLPPDTCRRRYHQCQPRRQSLARTYWPHATAARCAIVGIVALALATLATLALAADSPPPPAWTITDVAVAPVAAQLHATGAPLINHPLLSATRRTGQAGRRTVAAVGQAAHRVGRGLAEFHPFRRCR